ncbi:MAG: universal stress protein [Candidatus Krumholzibacteriia bacterium]
MKRFKNILLVHDRASRGRKALDRALDLARCNGASLKLVEVVEPPTGSKRLVKTSAGEVDLLEVITRDRTAGLERRAATLDAGDAQVSTRLLFGTPFIAITREAVQAGHDLVMVTAEGRGGLREHLFGSTSRHLLRKCPCPVWVVRPSGRRKGIRVLAAVDPGEEHPSGRELDRRILELASSLATMHDGTLDVVHAWNAVPRSTRVSSRSLARWNAEIMAAAEERLRTLVAEAELVGPPPRLHLPGGAPGLKIAEVARDRRSDVVVMGTLSRSGLTGLLIGNTSETVLQHLDASVLAVKPEGFVSPLLDPAGAR